MTARQQEQKADIIKKAVDLMRLRRMALSTERTYVQWIGSYIDWLAKHGSSLQDSRARIEAYLTSIANRGCAASTQNQAFNALLFLYQEVRREKLPEIRALRAKQPRHHGPSAGEEVTDACKLAGISPHDDRAFGAVYIALARAGFIEKCGTCIRKKGHGTAGGNVWRIKA